MDGDDIRVNWRAAIVPENGGQAVYGRLKKIRKGRAVVKLEHNLVPGNYCNLALMLPKSAPDEPMQFIEGRGMVSVSVLASSHFHVTLESLEIKGNGEELLNAHIKKYREMWNRP